MADETQLGRASKALPALAALLLSIAGCDVWRPPPDLRQAWRPEALAPAAADRPWQPAGEVERYRAPRDAWQDGTRALPETTTTYDLPTLVDLALRDNPDTRSAWERARAAAAEFGQALAPYYPTLTASVIVSPDERLLEHGRNDIETVHQDTYLPAISLTYVLFDFGRSAQSAERARQQMVAANFAFNRTMQDVVFDVQRAYYRLDAAQSLLRAAEQNLALARTVLAAANARLDVGLATTPEQLLASQSEARAVYDLENARVQVDDAHADLARTLGMPATRPLAIESVFDQPLPPALDRAVDAFVDTALAERPDLAARVAGLRAADAAVAQAQAQFLPAIDYRGSYGEATWIYRFNGGAPRVDSTQPVWSNVVGFRWDLFTGFERRNALRAARSQAAAARAELAATQLDVIAEIWRAYYDYRAATRRFAYAEALRAAAQKAYDANLKTYERGLSNIVDLLTAERDLATARYTVVQSRAELLIGAVRVAYAAGTLGLGDGRGARADPR
jgi:TolC family type I secretion outer membrane protein